MSESLDSSALDRLFQGSRSRNAWIDETLPDTTWRALYDLVKFGPTSMNSSPGRFVFVTTPEGKTRLKPHLIASNHKALGAPCVVIVGQDMAFHEKLPELFPARPEARKMFDGNEALIAATAFRNSSLEGGYLIMAARGLGLDVGPMSGFDHAGLDAEFFAGTTIRSNFICALGHGADTSFPRLPRLSFEDACQIV